MSLVNEQHLFLMDVVRLLNFAHNAGFVVTGGELYRTIEQQKLYVQEGKSKTMNSMHLKRCAIDLHFFKNGHLASAKDIEPVGRFWQELDEKNRWGGNFDRDWSKPDNFLDVPHFERKV